MRNIVVAIMALTVALTGCIEKIPVNEAGLRAPSYPLVTIDPFTNAWSPADQLYAAPVEHWTGAEYPLLGVLSVDGQTYRFLGKDPAGEDEPESKERFENAAVQTSVQVRATRTVYTFTCGPVDLQVDFLAPLLLDRLELVSRPVNYISYKIRSNDGARHKMSLYLEAGPGWALHNAKLEHAEGISYKQEGLLYAKAGKAGQKVLNRSGDNMRINWGYCYLAAADDGSTEAAVGQDGTMSLNRSLGKKSKSDGRFMIGYDDLYSISYFGEWLRPYWNADGTHSIEEQFETADAEFEALDQECAAFDAKMKSDAESAGGSKYAELCALAYRQAVAAHKLVYSPSGELMWISKENNSNGCLGTVDVAYPASPLFLLYNPVLAEGLMNPIFEYSESGRWTKPYPCHDIGHYPIAFGQYYGTDMPVEESGNMLTLCAATCKYAESYEYARKHWETLTTWADYLMEFGLDPDEQLCTDDFAGHLAHNVNLSAKAIVAIASFGQMAEGLGHAEVAQKYSSAAREMARRWVEAAADGDHFRLTFDREDSWSQKYNLIWDSLLGLDLFPAEVMQKEISYYLGKQNRYGLPLDVRSAYTKTDWILWTATMAQSREEFDALVNPVWDFYNETTDRVPMSDWVWSDKPEHVGFKARSVVGGLFIRMLKEMQD